MEREEIIDSVVIGDLEWSARNIEIVHTRYGMMPPHAWRDPETMGPRVLRFEGFGKLYLYKAAQEAVPEGWRIPEWKDWHNLMNRTGGAINLIDRRKWPRGEYIEDAYLDTGFNALPAGMWHERPVNAGLEACFWCKGGISLKVFRIGPDGFPCILEVPEGTMASLRVVRDVPREYVRPLFR